MIVDEAPTATAPNSRARWLPWILADLTALAGSAAALLQAPPTTLAVLGGVYLLAVSIWLSAIDIRTHRLPDRLIFPAYSAVAALLALYGLQTGDWAPTARALVAAVVTGFLYLALSRWGSLGLGDVKLGMLLAAPLGALSWSAALAGPFVGFLLGGLVAIALLARGRGRGTHIAFGPYLVAGAIVAAALALT